MPFVLDHDHCLDLEHVLGYEWLETNGLGSYASSTPIDCATRKYHGLLVCNLAQPEGKFVLLAKLETSLLVGQATYDLTVNQYPGVFNPSGHHFMDGFRYDLHPQLEYRVGELRLERAVLMPRGHQTVLVRYTLRTARQPVTVRLRPFLPYRDHHAISRQNDQFRAALRQTSQGFAIAPYPGMPPLHVDLDAPCRIVPHAIWYYNLEYREEQARGLDFQEDVSCPCWIDVPLAPGGSFIVRASLDAPGETAALALWETELTRRRALAREWAGEPGPRRRLKATAEHFLIHNPRGEASIVAGYPWFAEWGRDTMIALPGLTLACGRADFALEILRSYADHERDGLIPNFLATGSDRHAYNSADASLWFLRAVQQYLAATGDSASVTQHLVPVMRRILKAFLSDAAPHVRLRPDGLLEVGTEHTQLTWMDATVNNRPVTPRHGLAVELNGLWYDALCFLHELLGPGEPRLSALRDAAGAAFVTTFWLPDRRYLADVVNAQGVDAAVRPNQVIACALAHSPLTVEQRRDVLRRVDTDLLTPYGLRSLAPHHPSYCRRYQGGTAERDGAYHQGTVWGWLVGPYVEAALRAAPDPAATARRLQEYFAPLFQEHLHQAGLDAVAEIFDAEPPHTPRGAPFQAWSVGEVIRAQELLAAALR